MSVPNTSEPRKKPFSQNHSRAECHMILVFIRGIGLPFVIEFSE